MATDDARRYGHIGSALVLLRAIRVDWCSLYELSARLRLHQRSVRRLIDVLRAHDVPIEQRARDRAGLSPVAEYRTRVTI